MNTPTEWKADSVASPTSSNVPAFQKLEEGYKNALRVVDDVVLKNYITELSHMDVVPLSEELTQSNIRDNVRLFKITEMVYEKNELATYKFASVFNALAITDSTIFIILDSDGVKTDFYMGVRSQDETRTISSLKNTLENAMKGQFPGIKTFDNYTVEDVEQFVSRIPSSSVSAVTCVANNRAHENATNQNFVQGLEKLVLSMQGEKYTGIIIANCTSQGQLRQIRKGYETIYSQLSPFASSQINYSSNRAFTYSKSDTSGSSHADTTTEQQSETTGKAVSESYSTQHGVSRENFGSKAVKGLAAASSILGAAFAPVSGGLSLAVGGVISGGLGLLGSAITSNVSDSTSNGTSTSDNYSTTTGSSTGVTDTTSYSHSETQGNSNGTSEGMTLSLHDKSVEDTLERINKQLKRIDEFESLGMYECAAYFLSDNQYAAEIAASTYKALMRGENSGLEIAAINSWGDSQAEATHAVGQYVKNFMHPVFQYKGLPENIEVTPCALVSGNELAVHMGLPRHSVCGLPVIEHADFGKEVVSYDDDGRQQRGIRLGNVYNMGSTGNSTVYLNTNSLAMHTFVTGSTGSGKSNTIYEMIRQLDTLGIKYLIIEPAKGEYKGMFGGRSDVQVYSTNPRKTKLLRINPFAFPVDEISVQEHLDRLVEIFNVCWPMYAAMPAILKDACERAYAAAGWDIAASINWKKENSFPCFADVLEQIKKVLEESAYSADNKSDYTGALVTRVRSLTTGIYGQVFTNDNEAALFGEKLFDENVIVDLSRVGSTETKSLIMGLLVMQMQEYRMASAKEANSALKHITVLEEAHNILKRTSTEQSAESANLAGKSVEMLSNAIAEMRTYGEGFIIADQAPGLLDMAAIRNTNTKIIMRLPDEEDRKLVGKAAGLNDDQVAELSKLPTGVAAVYQNNWIEPVLCKIQRFDSAQPLKYIPESQTRLTEVLSKYFMAISRQERPDLNDEEIDMVHRWSRTVSSSAETIRLVGDSLQGKPSDEKARVICYNLLDGSTLCESVINSDNVHLQNVVSTYLTKRFGFDDALAKTLCNLILMAAAYDYPEKQHQIREKVELLNQGGEVQ